MLAMKAHFVLILTMTWSSPHAVSRKKPSFNRQFPFGSWKGSRLCAPVRDTCKIQYIYNDHVPCTAMYQRSRLDKCGSCCIKPMANRVHFFGSTAGLARTHFHYLTHRYTRKWPSETHGDQVIESRNIWFVAEHLEQILRGRVPCNVR